MTKHTEVKIDPESGALLVDVNNPLVSAPRGLTVTVTDDPTPLPETPLEGRKKLIIINTSTVDLYITDEEGEGEFPIPPDIPISFDAPSNVIIYAKVVSGTVDISILELK